ncbi:connectin-like [Leguminivora glycinivorella]|uniref:connectin-like n=1 Tax=Leguminivora glycinivorella TaxID=1035111 RepID=UPI00200BCC3D|nr:connectin-like [Leguminivora glycinivorella]
MDSKYLILIIVFATIEISVVGNRHSERRRWKYEKAVKTPFVNVCNIEDRSARIHCYCDSIEYKMAMKADCWIFNGDITEDDPFWTNFLSQPKLEILGFSVRADSKVTYIPAKIIIRLENLQYFRIQYANISHIPPFVFTNSSTLREISLPKNKITKLERKSFSNMILLVNVSLVQNRISELERDVFYMLPNLRRLTLSDNNITILHEGCFKHLNNLVKLDLDSNLLTVVTREDFRGLSNLITLNMRNNKLSMIGDFAFSKLWALQELSLDENEIQFISQKGFAGLARLRKLSLTDNNLRTLDAGVLDNFEKLTVLDLQNNNLDTLKQETMQSVLGSMKSNNALISLEGNKLTCDCSLRWIFGLNNETRSKRLKAALESVTCIMDDKSNMAIGEKKNIPKNQTTNDYENDEFDDEVDTVEYKNLLRELSPEMLRCSNKISHEASDSPPTDNEVSNHYSTSSYVAVATTLYMSISVSILF